MDDGILFFLALTNKNCQQEFKKSVARSFQFQSSSLFDLTQVVDEVVPDAVVLVAVDVVVVVDAEPAQHRDLSPAPRLLPLTRFVNHLVNNIHPDRGQGLYKRDWRKVKVLLSSHVCDRIVLC